MIQIEPRMIGESIFFRRAAGPGTTARTEPAAETILHLRHERDRLIVERAKHKQAAHECEAAIKEAIGAGRDAAQHRQALSKLDDTIETLGAEIDDLIGVIEDVRQQAITHYAAPIARQFEAGIAASLETFQVPEELTHV